MKYFEIEVDGRREKVWAERVRGKLWYHVRGRTFADMDLETKSRAGKGGTSSHPGKIAAPMPGRVTKILTSLGTEVTPGTPLVVMEAMKMEYTLAADLKGKVAGIPCAVGDQVTLGQVLVILERGPG